MRVESGQFTSLTSYVVRQKKMNGLVFGCESGCQERKLVGGIGESGEGSVTAGESERREMQGKRREIVWDWR